MEMVIYYKQSYVHTDNVNIDNIEAGACVSDIAVYAYNLPEGSPAPLLSIKYKPEGLNLKKRAFFKEVDGYIYKLPTYYLWNWK